MLKELHERLERARNEEIVLHCEKEKLEDMIDEFDEVVDYNSDEDIIKSHLKATLEDVEEQIEDLTNTINYILQGIEAIKHLQ